MCSTMTRPLRFLLIVSTMFAVPLLGTAVAEYEVIDVSNGGTIKGVAIWKGAVPKIPLLAVKADLDTCGETAPSPVLKVDPKTRGLQNVLVYLEQVEKGKAPEDKYWLHMGKDNSGKEPGTELCQFKEHILAFVRTQQVAIINFDPILHNPHFFTDKHGSIFNVAMPTPNKEVDKTLLRAQGVGLAYQCDVHVHMNGYAGGFDHPYFAVTDAEGKFEISGVPPGTYTLIAWHEGYKIEKMVSSRPAYDEPHIVQKQVDVKSKDTVEEHFEFPVRPGTMN
jgi:polysaccharide lyase family 4-like protein